MRNKEIQYIIDNNIRLYKGVDLSLEELLKLYDKFESTLSSDIDVKYVTNDRVYTYVVEEETRKFIKFLEYVRIYLQPFKFRYKIDFNLYTNEEFWSKQNRETIKHQCRRVKHSGFFVNPKRLSFYKKMFPDEFKHI